MSDLKKNITIIICIVLVGLGGFGTFRGIQGQRSSKVIISDLVRENGELGESLDRIRGKFDEIRTGIGESQETISALSSEVSGNTERIRQSILIVQELEELIRTIESIVFEPDERVSEETN